jgi:hypothetical protein
MTAPWGLRVKGERRMVSNISSKTPGNSQEVQDIDCFSCIHFFITYDQVFPYGCKAAGFKSQIMPCKDMFANSGILCQLFQEKKKTR